MNILVLCTYPISNPMHGGQLRVRSIVAAYRAAGHNVEVVGVLGSESYENESGFLAFPGVKILSSILSNPFLMEDYAIGELFSCDDVWYERLAAKIISAPDVVHVEQPWLFGFARRYIKSHSLRASLFYGSQNIECDLKEQILSSYFDAEAVQRCVDLIRDIEIYAIRNSDAAACVSNSDATWLRRQADKPVVLAPNGVKGWRSTEAGRSEARALSRGYRYSLYCASAHPPNVTGFFEMFGGGFGSLKPDEKLVVAGGAGWSIAGDKRVHQSAKLAEKIVVGGMVNQSCLEGLLDGAQAIVLPLTQGGGTNLKTAEALWAGKHIIATSIAMRGFERFADARGIHVADNPATFKRALRLAMESEPLQLNEAELDERRVVLWDYCLEPLIEVMRKFEKGISA